MHVQITIITSSIFLVMLKKLSELQPDLQLLEMNSTSGTSKVEFSQFQNCQRDCLQMISHFFQ